MFTIFWKEHRVGETKWRRQNNTHQSVTRLRAAAQVLDRTIAITTDRHGFCRSLRVRQGDAVVAHCPRTGVAFFDPYSPDVLRPLLRRARGREVRAAALLPTSQIVNLAIKRTGRRNGLYVYSGRADEWHFELLADLRGRVVLLHSRADEFYVVRHADVKLIGFAAPTQRVHVERNVRIAMRDGVRLAADIYFPRRQRGQRWPAILIRTPYGRKTEEPEARYYARRGYVVAVQDVRGRFDSGGTFDPFVNEAGDGVDTIEWLAAKRWCTGRVGMVGGSYLGLAQLQAAANYPAALAAIAPSFAPPGPLCNIPYDHGCFALYWAIWWLALLEQGVSGRPGVQFSAEQLKLLPVRELDVAVFGRKHPVWRRWLAQSPGRAYWLRAEYLEALGGARVAGLHITGWFDGNRMGAIRSFRAMQHTTAPQRLIVGPWVHGALTRSIAGHDFGPEAVLDIQAATVQWLDAHLKNSAATDTPRVSLFVMGRNEWVHGTQYPLERVREERWYLGGRATHVNVGTLSRSRPTARSRSDSYTYDPLAVSVEHAEPDHLRLSADTLCYATRPFRAPYTILGPLTLVLYARSSARDTDWHVGLEVLDERQRVMTLSHGSLRARYRQSLHRAALLRPNHVYRYRVQLWDTAIRFAPGWRMVLRISSALFPSYSRNLNTGGASESHTQAVAARQSVYSDASRASYLSVSRLEKP